MTTPRKQIDACLPGSCKTPPPRVTHLSDISHIASRQQRRKVRSLLNVPSEKCCAKTLILNLQLILLIRSSQAVKFTYLVQLNTLLVDSAHATAISASRSTGMICSTLNCLLLRVRAIEYPFLKSKDASLRNPQPDRCKGGRSAWLDKRKPTGLN